MNLKGFLQDKRDGATFEVVNGQYKSVSKRSGFWVAITDNRVKSATGRELNKLRKIAGVLKLSGYYFGYWPDGGEVCLDLSIWIKDKAEALTVGRLHNQIAIWDIKNNKELKCSRS